MAGSQSFWEEGLLVTSSSLTSGWRRIENRGQNPQDAVNAGAGPQGHSLPPWPAAQHRPGRHFRVWLCRQMVRARALTRSGFPIHQVNHLDPLLGRTVKTVFYMGQK